MNLTYDNVTPYIAVLVMILLAFMMGRYYEVRPEPVCHNSTVMEQPWVLYCYHDGCLTVNSTTIICNSRYEQENISICSWVKLEERVT
jgi:biopolymer transport protein ExbD